MPRSQWPPELEESIIEHSLWQELGWRAHRTLDDIPDEKVERFATIIREYMTYAEKKAELDAARAAHTR